MQMMPKINWPQRVDSDAVARDEIASDVLVATVSSIPVQLIRAFRFASQRLIGKASRDAFSSLTRFLHGGLNKTSVAWRMPGRMPGIKPGGVGRGAAPFVQRNILAAERRCDVRAFEPPFRSQTAR